MELLLTKVIVILLLDRNEDLMLFAHFFLEKANQQLNKNIIGFSKEVIGIIQHYAWRGNLRELQNCIKRATLLTQGSWIEKSVLPNEIIENRTDFTDLSLMENEKNAIISALNKTDNNKSEASKLLKITRKTLYNKLKLYNLD